MKTVANKKTEEAILQLCGEVRSEDGISSKELAKRELAESRKRDRAKPNHHLRQLCKQIYHAIDMAIICDCGDPILDDLKPVWVRPVPKSNNLEVTFTTNECDLDYIAKMHETLNRVGGLLRSAVAGSISRKQVPQLRFKIVPEKHLD